MRLTLRTLLAYIDGILDPQDQEELAKRIEASENASDLIHRTGDTMRRMRLGAPPVDSATHNANAVAEYLDNTMSPEQVVEFERRCLESDPELAEAAACHQILTMVLGQRADVDIDTRRVMYGLPTRVTPGQPPQPAEAQALAEAPSAAPSEAPVAASPVAVEDPADSVPDYLKASRRSVAWRLMPAAVMLLVLAGVAYLAFRPGGWLTAGGEPAVAPGDADGGESPSSPPPSDDTVVAAPEPAAAEEPEPLTPSSPPADETPEATPSLPDFSPPATGDQPTEPPRATDSAATPDASPPDATTVAPSAGRDPFAGLPEPFDGASPDGDAPPPGTGPPTPTDMPDAAAGPDDLAADPAATPGAEPEGSAVVGLATLQREVLLRQDRDAGVWRRLPRSADIETGDRLLALPTYRPVIDLQGVRLELAGATLVQISPGDASRGSDAARVELLYGGLVATNTGGAEAELEIGVGELTGLAKLDRGAVLAVEADRPFTSGADPEEMSTPLVATFYAPLGGLDWSSDFGQLTIDSGSLWRLAGDSVGPLEPYDAEVDWISGPQLTSLQREASPEIERKLRVDDSVRSQLSELAAGRRREERALAAICSVHVGDFGPFVAALRDADQKAAWEEEIETLRSAMSRSPELARSIRETLVEQRGEERAADLFRMLRGFTADEVGRDRESRQSGALRQLIDWLESDQPDYRVLANHNLEQITGRRGVFNPTGPLRSRELAIARYRTRLKNDEVLPRGDR